jgi:hypothetical protein
MGWQAQVFARLRAAPDEWQRLNDLFETVEANIPLHYAMRHAMQPNYGRTELLLNTHARWLLFLKCLHRMAEAEPVAGPRWRLTHCVRLRRETCVRCGNAGYPESWRSRRFVCQCRNHPQEIATDAGPMADDRRDRILGMATAAASFSEPLRRHAIADLIHERFRPLTLEAAMRGEPPDIPCSVEETILSAYPSPAAYWHAWLYDPLPAEGLVARLAEPTAAGEVELAWRVQRLHAVLARCPLDLVHTAARDVARWLAQHPDTEGLLPPTLLTYLSLEQKPGRARPEFVGDALILPDGSRVVEEIPGNKTGEAAMPAAPPEAQADAEPPIASEADAEGAYLERLTKERESTGRAPTRDADYYEWVPWVRRRWGFHVTQEMIDNWRRKFLTDAEKKGGPPRRRK